MILKLWLSLSLMLLMWMSVGSVKPGLKDTIRVYNLSDPILMNPPPAPMCHVKINSSAQAKKVTMTMWKTSPETPIGEGTVVAKYRYLTSCTQGVLGGVEKVMEKRYALKIVPQDLELPPTESLILDEFTDITSDSAYTCKWWSTEAKTTERLLIKRVKVFLAEKGHLVADNLDWTPSSSSTMWNHGAWILLLGSDKVEHCPYEPFKKIEGLLFNASHDSQVFLGDKDHIRFVIDSKKRPVICATYLTDLYPTDMGIPISIDDLPHSQDATGLSVQWETREINNALFESEVLFELHHLANSINSNFEALDLHLCLGRRTAWSQAVRSNDANALAVYMSHDPFAIGNFANDKFSMRFRIPMDWNITLDQIHLEDGNKIRLVKDSIVHSLEPASGIIDSPYNTTLNMPPLLEMTNGGYFNLKSHSMDSHRSDSWVHSKILIDEINITNYDTKRPDGRNDDTMPNPDSITFIGFWETWAQVIGWSIFLILSFWLMLWFLWSFREILVVYLCFRIEQVQEPPPVISSGSSGSGSEGRGGGGPGVRFVNNANYRGNLRNRRAPIRRVARAAQGRVRRAPAPRRFQPAFEDHGWLRNYVM